MSEEDSSSSIGNNGRVDVVLYESGGTTERWISIQLGVWLDRYPFNNGYLVGLE